MLTELLAAPGLRPGPLDPLPPAPRPRRLGRAARLRPLDRRRQRSRERPPCAAAAPFALAEFSHTGNRSILSRPTSPAAARSAAW